MYTLATTSAPLFEFIWTVDDWWIVLTGALAAGACAIVGCFLVVRRMSMMGDAISHAVLPGLALAFLLTGRRDSITMFVGAAALGMLTALFTQLLHRWGRVDTHASMGIVFTTLFAIGLILIVRGADAVDLDPGCVLFGAIEFTPLDTVMLGGIEIPRATVMLGIMLIANLAFVLLLFKELRITSFDPELSNALGINAGVVHYLFMAMVAATTVAAFEAVGSILVVAMLIVPAATALLLTSRLTSMIIVSVGLASAASGLGHLGAVTVPQFVGASATNTAGSIAVASGVLLVITIVIAPRHGFVSQVIRRARLQLRIAQEDVIGLLYRIEEQIALGRQHDVTQTLRKATSFHPLLIKLAIYTLQRRQLVEISGDDVLRLRERGQTMARQLVRSHRLWEAYLSQHIQVPSDHLHQPAMNLEHYTDSHLTERLALEAGEPGQDPHGRVVPAAESTNKRTSPGPRHEPGE